MLVFGCVETPLVIKWREGDWSPSRKIIVRLGRDSAPENDDDLGTLVLSRTMPPVVLRETVWREGVRVVRNIGGQKRTGIRSLSSQDSV